MNEIVRKCRRIVLFASFALLVQALSFGSAIADSANKYSVAVIIGNTNYQERIPTVDYAANDADAFKYFVLDVLGYDAANIIDLRDATKAQMETAFGNTVTHEGKLWRYLDPKGRSDVTVSYSGHGVPGLKDRRGYLLPVDADVETPEINGFSRNTLFENLGELEAKSITVFLDACFSGESQKGSLVKAASGISITPRFPMPSKAMTVVTAARGDQLASWDIKAQHGLFSTHLLDALYGKADGKEYGNSDGKVSLSEVKTYLDDNMTRAARRDYGRNQNAWIRGDESTVLSIVTDKKRVASLAIVSKQKVKSLTKETPTIKIYSGSGTPGDVFRDCQSCPEMVAVPAGSFLMGDINGDYSYEEKPVHRVTFKKNFAVGKYEVTQRQWRELMGTSPSNFTGENLPVEKVSWDDARMFIRKLNKKTGLNNQPNRYRLLSESEWEYAARAGTKTKYHYGDSISKSEARFASNETAPVGSYPANAFGIHDMHGNVWERVEDCSNDHYRGAPTDGRAWTAGDCIVSILRGGSWQSNQNDLRSAMRFSFLGFRRDNNFGFRIARSLGN